MDLWRVGGAPPGSSPPVGLALPHAVVIEVELDPPDLRQRSVDQSASGQRMGQGAAIDELQLTTQRNPVGDA